MAHLPKRFTGPIDQLLASIVSNVETAFQIRSRLNGMKTVSSTASIQSWVLHDQGLLAPEGLWKNCEQFRWAKHNPLRFTWSRWNPTQRNIVADTPSWVLRGIFNLSTSSAIPQRCQYRCSLIVANFKCFLEQLCFGKLYGQSQTT